MSAPHTDEKKGHVCPPSKAVHPSDRWESMFVYGFICKFTRLREKVEGLETPMDFENALLSHEPDPIITQILGQFVLNLRPQTRNLSTDQISTTVASVLADYFKTSERTVFWNDELRRNVDPFEGLEGGFFATDWDFKLKILRILVELQLCHTPDIKNTIDRAWGVTHNKHKKKEPISAPPDPNDPLSRERLQLIPLGQDSQRKRFWVADDSPRIYASTNPWKVTATFQTIASTREEYLATIQTLKDALGDGQRRTKLEIHHAALIEALEARLEAIDAEIARVNKVRKKIEQRNLLLAQAEIRETRTRRQTRRPDYVYNEDPDSEEDAADEYKYQEDEEIDDFMDEDGYLDIQQENPNGARYASSSSRQRRSTRNAVSNSNGRRSAPDTWSQWRGERRSSRLGAPPDTLLDDIPSKRARTEESTVSSHSADVRSNTISVAAPGDSSSLKIKIGGAAAVKPSEIALEQVQGRKKSKFWFYAVEPIPPPPGSGSGSSSSSIGVVPEVNGHQGNGDTGKGAVDMDVDSHLEGSLSPASSVDS